MSATVLAWFTPTTKPWELLADAREALKADPPPPAESELIVRDYFEQTQTATFWTRKPSMFEASALAMRTRFGEYDPRRAHPYRKSRLKLWVPQLTEEAPVYAGAHLEVIGRVQAVNVLWPLKPPLVEWIVQLAPITTRRGLVYCRVTRSFKQRPQLGKHYVARGLVIAGGGVDLAGGGFTNAAYMACSSMRRPYGEIGKFTLFLEKTNIDMASLGEKATNEAEFGRLFDAQVTRAINDDPALELALRKLLPERG